MLEDRQPLAGTLLLAIGLFSVVLPRWLDMPSGDCFSFAEHDGMIETMADLGATVEKGQVLARIHAVDRTGEAANEIRAKISGRFVARHFPGLVKSGDCAAVLAVGIG